MSGSPPLRRVLLAGAGILAGYLVILWVVPGTWGRLVLPNLWLAGASLAALRGRALRALDGSTRPIAGAMVAVLSALLLILFAAWWPLGEGHLPRDAALQAVVLVGAVPLAEELYFRGLLLPALAERWGGAAATAMVSLLFAWLHLPQGLFLPMLLLSLALCVLALLTGTALWTTGVHLAWNAAALARELPPGPERWQLVLGALAALTAIMAWGLASRRDRAR